jgi:diguanylate cyclase (GGDEF)-like protein/PAS domain S-box-containing protein
VIKFFARHELFCGDRFWILSVVLLSILLFPSLTIGNGSNRVLRLSVANSAAETGLVHALAQDFMTIHPGIQIDIQSAGALVVLKFGQEGKADLIITHHPASEKLFVDQGYGLSRTLIMYNQFALMGPPEDTLNLIREKDPLVVLRKVASAEPLFAVPGARSGTNKKLAELWLLAGVEPEWLGYENTQSSAAATLRYAAQMDAYAFADMGTYLANRQQVSKNLVPLFRDHIALRNYYSAIVVNQKIVPSANQQLAQQFLDYLVSDRGQQTLQNFGVERFGSQVFTPAAHLDEGLKARRAQKLLAEQDLNLKQLTALSVLLALATLIASGLFSRTRQLARSTRLSEERFQLAVDGSNDGIWDWNLSADQAYFSRHMLDLLGMGKDEEIISDPQSALTQAAHPDDSNQVNMALEKYLDATNSPGEQLRTEFRVLDHDNNVRWLLMRGKAKRSENGEVVRMSGSLSDISERKRQEAEFEHQALHDALTGLPNRTLLLDRLNQSILSAERENRSMAIIMMDLNRFKEINDTLGHQVGDLVLQQVGARLQKILRASDTVVRLGGDEFAILLPRADGNYSNHVAQKISLAMKKVFDLGRHNLYVGGSLGIALFPEHGEDAENLIKHADVAMYVAKRSNSSCATYSPEQDQHSIKRLALEKELHEAIDNNSLELHYQPKIDVRTARIIGVEALLRWKHPERGYVSPDEMIPIAEQTGLIKSLTNWVLNSALRQCADWRKDGPDITVAINISVWNLQDPNLVHHIQDRLAAWNVPASQLQLEITESAMMADPEHAMRALTTLDRMGIKLAIDDFGTGFSSLAYLKKLPVDIIKIDKSFVQGIVTDKDDASIVRSTIELAHNLNLEVVAEGVENQETLDRLAIMGCETAQGYFLGRPQTAESLVQWFDESPWGLNSKGHSDLGALVPSRQQH